jgi:hypothetical protein
MALPVLDAAFASSADLPRRQLLSKWLVNTSYSGTVDDFYNLPERYLYAKIAVELGGPRTEQEYIELPKSYAWSDIYGAIIFNRSAPASPSNLTLTPLTSSSMRLNWVTNGASVAYSVERSVDGAAFQVIGTTAIGATTATNTGLNIANNYQYRIRGSSGGFFTGYSNTASSVYDANASSFINAVVSTGATVTGAQITAINSFYVTAKSQGYYSSIKRLYLPIWGVAAANAIDMISLTSGTFFGGVTHGSGYIQGNGSTGYFDTGTSSTPPLLGMNNSNAALMVLMTNASGTSIPIGSRTPSISANNRFQINTFGLTQSAMPTNTSGGVNMPDSDLDGIFIAGLTATNSRYLHRRRTAGVTLVTSSTNDTETLSTDRPFILARNSGGTADLFNSAIRVGVAGFGTAIQQDDAANLSTNIKSLWETCTGLTLP